MPEVSRHRVAKLEGRVSGFEGHFGTIYRRLDGIEQRFDRRFEALEERTTRSFVWMIGIQVSVLLAVVAALVGR